MFSPPSQEFSGIDGIPVLAQLKVAYQFLAADEVGAKQTWERCTTYGVIASQLRSGYEFATGSLDAAVQRQKQFAQGLGSTLRALPESIPLLGYCVAAAAHCTGDRDRGDVAFRKASRSCAVLGAAAFVWCAAPLTPSGVPFAAIVAPAASAAAGLAADVLLVRSPTVPRPWLAWSPGERFDWAILRLLDAVRGVCIMDLATLLTPEHVTQISVWTEPISVSSVADLVLGGHGMAAAHHFMLDHLPSGAVHAYVLLKTSHGGLLVTERVHDGQILMEDLSRGFVAPFAHGHDLPLEALPTVSRAAAHVLQHVQQAGSSGAAALPSEAGAATLFAGKDLNGGPSVAALANFARDQSTVGYDLLTSNCQHYVDSVYKFVDGGALAALPNEQFMSFFRRLWHPSVVESLSTPGPWSNLHWAVRVAPPSRIAVDAAMAFGFAGASGVAHHVPELVARTATHDSEHSETAVGGSAPCAA